MWLCEQDDGVRVTVLACVPLNELNIHAHTCVRVRASPDSYAVSYTRRSIPVQHLNGAVAREQTLGARGAVLVVGSKPDLPLMLLLSPAL